MRLTPPPNREDRFLVSSDASDDVAVFDQIGRHCDVLRLEIERVIVGQKRAVEVLLTAMLCQGNLLIEGVPGLAKTLLVQTLASALDLKFKRIQFTPDMMPSDILGTDLIQEDPATGRRELRFARGPIFAQLILADEVNRTPPKTQAALLEAMAERQVTVAGKTMELQEPFMVVATQNPIDQEGTYPLPEAQLDRFMFSLWMDYPSKQEEVQIVNQMSQVVADRAGSVLGHDVLLRCNRVIGQMPASGHVVDYAVSLVRATRPQAPDAPGVTRRYIDWGAGPRASQFLILGAKALAATEGQPTPSCEHVRRIAREVLRHRMVVNYSATGEGVTPDTLVTQILAAVKEPQYDPPA